MGRTAKQAMYLPKRENLFFLTVDKKTILMKKYTHLVLALSWSLTGELSD